MRKRIFAMIILLTGFFDYITFAINKEFQSFEINPLYILAGNAWIIVLLKVIVIAAVIFIMNSKKNNTYFSTYFFTTIACFLIILQVLGGMSNLKIAKDNPQPSQAMTEQEAVSTHITLSIFLLYIPLLMCIISFKTWEFLYIKKDRRKIKDEINY